MSNYYAYSDVKRAIVHRLFDLEGWKVYGYYPDNSDPYTDYYDPEHWGGIAEKNGFILCINTPQAGQQQEHFTYENSGSNNAPTQVKIKKLEAMTIENGATAGEAENAQKLLAKLLEKSDNEKPIKKLCEVVPAHMANPRGCNWHIEKDGVYVDKGSGLLKFAGVSDKEDNSTADELRMRLRRYYSDDADLEKGVQYRLKEIEKSNQLFHKFNELIRRIDSACGGMIGNADEEIRLEKKTVTKYKTEIKAHRIENGEIKDGQCFRLVSNFSYGCRKGYIYRIHVTESGYSCGVKLNGKLTKECTGHANSANTFTAGEKLLTWIEKGFIEWVELKEEKVPYEVEKIVKVKVKTDTESAATDENPKYKYAITEDTDTRDNSKLYVVKVLNALDRDEYKECSKYMRTKGGYYSKFKHGFIFRENPEEILQEAI